jgi:hypothetical protein
MTSQGRVEFLVEVCDPSEASDFSYTVNGIVMSDFYTPNYFDPVASGGVRYSFTGAITEPRQVLKGGYLSWHDPVSNDWWQEQYFEDKPNFVNLGPLTGMESLRAQIERHTNVQSMRSMTQSRGPLLSAARAYPSQVARSDECRAKALMAQIEGLKTGGSDSPTATSRRPIPRPGR